VAEAAYASTDLSSQVHCLLGKQQDLPAVLVMNASASWVANRVCLKPLCKQHDAHDALPGQGLHGAYSQAESHSITHAHSIMWLATTLLFNGQRVQLWLTDLSRLLHSMQGATHTGPHILQRLLISRYLDRSRMACSVVSHESVSVLAAGGTPSWRCHASCQLHGDMSCGHQQAISRPLPCHAWPN
jgi:hypothetical protein